MDTSDFVGMDGVAATLPLRPTTGLRSFFEVAGDVYERVGSRIIPLTLSGAAREVVHLRLSACPKERIASVDLIALENADRLEVLVNRARDFRRCGCGLPDLIA